MEYYFVTEKGPADVFFEIKCLRLEDIHDKLDPDGDDVLSPPLLTLENAKAWVTEHES
jgi:hypothetical protein